MLDKRFLVVGDIHLKWEKAEELIQKYGPEYDKVVLLGDYTDHFIERGSQNTTATATWLKHSLQDPNRIHLMGNHDIAYRYRNYYPAPMCGFTYKKYDIINAILTPEDWQKIKMFHTEMYDDDLVVFSHAGFHYSHVPFSRNTKHLRERLDSYDVHDGNTSNPWLRPGMDRGFSDQVTGGPLWCDWSRISDMPSMFQIVGHTPSDWPKRTDGCVCIDTGLKYLAAVDLTSDKLFTAFAV